MRSSLRFGLSVIVASALGIFAYAADSGPQTGSWVPAGELAAARADAAAVLLYDGRILVTGGRTGEGPVRTADLFTPATGFQPAEAMLSERSGHAAVTLFDGRVLVTGGVGVNGLAVNSAEIYDPTTNAWSAVPAPMSEAHAGHTATLLDDGRVLIAGGNVAGVPSSTFEVFDPTLDEFHPGGVLSAPRMQHAAALLADGRVLIAGGTDGNVALSSVDIVDADAGWVGQATMTDARTGLTATTLLDGRVLLAGGANATGELTSAELFDAASGSFTPTSSPLTAARRNHLAFLLPHNNQVLIVGGLANDNAVATAEYFTPWEGPNGTFCGAPLCASGYAGPAAPAAPRVGATGSALSFAASATNRSGAGDGLLLVAGGSGQQSAELFGFATIKTDKADYAPGTTVTITGSGWQPYESVALVLVEQPLLDTHPLLDVTADANGNIVSTEFTPDVHDLNIRFTLTAYGTASQAQTTFTDAISLQLKGSDGSPHTNVNSAQNLGAIAQGTDLSLACPGGLTIKATGLGNSGTQAWSVGYGGGGTHNSILSPLTTLSPGSGTLTSTNDNSCIGVTIGTSTLTVGTTYQGSLQASGAGANDAIYFFVFNVISGCSAPTLTLQPVDQSVTYGQSSVSFTAAANGSPAPTVQWQQNNGSGFTDISGATTTTLTINSPAVAQTGTRYRAVFTNTCGGTQTATSNPATLAVDKATATVVVTPYTVTYDGEPHTATVASIAGVNGETGAAVGTVDVSSTTHTDAGTYSSDTWSFTGTANYADIAATTIIDTINKATATVVVTPYTVTYDGQPHTATVASIDGVNGETGATVGTVDLSNTAHTNAGTYNSDTSSFTGTVNYADIAATTITDTINKATAIVVVTPYTVTYDGQAHTATVTSITGVNGESGATVGTVDLNHTTHTDAGAYSSDTWSFTGTANYADVAATTITDTINKATATVVVDPYTVTYDGQPHTATVTSIAGVNGESGATVGTVDVSSTMHTAAGTYSSDFWSFTGTANYADIAASTIIDTINKAAATVVVTPYTVTYDGQPHTATVTSIAGVNGEAGATVGTVDVSSTTHTAAGTYSSDFWSFTGTPNYADIAATPITDTINKAPSVTTVVCPASVIYNGAAQTPCTASYSGAGALSGSLTPTYSNNTYPGTATANATYAGDANHTGSTASATFTIAYGVCNAAYGPGGVILPPINNDGTSVYQRKGGSTIPVKFTVCDASGMPISNLAAVFSGGTEGALTMLSAVRGTVDVVSETGISDVPDVAFRWTGDKWMFNMATSNLMAGTTYTFRINLALGSIQFRVGVK